eukprot:NODE_4472_length_658_cov_44.201970_g3823_i0.p1 GENE.NODE_4472_length_658_cov_44.201970_g3823_i0~~NODE_4472_length_658_cov_44.201970_g3823_i0.p1  ORF type:complete len:101 (-),score=30.02 NODE_4472_length_658_cov_44.201970_g3823_i0:123-425(-)
MSAMTEAMVSKADRARTLALFPDNEPEEQPEEDSKETKELSEPNPAYAAAKEAVESTSRIRQQDVATIKTWTRRLSMINSNSFGGGKHLLDYEPTTLKMK